MKKIILLLVLILSVSPLFAQDLTPMKPERKVPIIVSEAFQSKYSAKDPVWFSQYQGLYNDKLVYEARFMFDNRYSSAIFDRDGEMIAFATTIEASEIPQKAIDYMKKNYADRGVTEAMLVARGKNETSVELGIYINNRFTIVVFDKDGNFIKTTLG